MYAGRFLAREVGGRARWQDAGVGRARAGAWRRRLPVGGRAGARQPHGSDSAQRLAPATEKPINLPFEKIVVGPTTERREVEPKARPPFAELPVVKGDRMCPEGIRIPLAAWKGQLVMAFGKQCRATHACYTPRQITFASAAARAGYSGAVYCSSVLLHARVLWRGGVPRSPGLWPRSFTFQL